MLLGLLMNYLHFQAVAMLFWSAVVNGVLAPPLIVLVVLASSDRKVMGDRVSSQPASDARLGNGRRDGAGCARDVRHDGFIEDWG